MPVDKVQMSRRGFLAIGVAAGVVTLALEVPTTWRVARGAPIPTGPAVVRSKA